MIKWFPWKMWTWKALLPSPWYWNIKAVQGRQTISFFFTYFDKKHEIYPNIFYMYSTVLLTISTVLTIKVLSRTYLFILHANLYPLNSNLHFPLPSLWKSPSANFLRVSGNLTLGHNHKRTLRDWILFPGLSWLSTHHRLKYIS